MTIPPKLQNLKECFGLGLEWTSLMLVHSRPGPNRFHVGRRDPIEGMEHGVEINNRENGRRGVLETKLVLKHQGGVERFKLV